MEQAQTSEALNRTRGSTEMTDKQQELMSIVERLRLQLAEKKRAQVFAMGILM